MFDRARDFFRRHKKFRVALAVAAAALLALALLLLALRPRGMRSYLVLGMDNYGSLEDTGRSDVMMLVQIDFSHTKISAVTFARDLQIPGGYGKDVKINTIVRNHDEQALVSAIENCFALKIDGWFRVNFTSVIQLVDALGGAQVELTAAEARYIDKQIGAYPDSPLSEGLCRLNGEQALTYARCRKLDNDFGRGDRQSKLVAALVAQTKRLTPGRLLDVFTSLRHAWRSSLSASEQARLFASALWLRGAQVERIGVPFEGTYHYGGSMVIANLQKNRDMLLAALGLSPAPEAEEQP